MMALEMLNLRFDLDKLKALSGGFPRWRELGYPVEGSGPEV
jgi:hypothetical protein